MLPGLRWEKRWSLLHGCEEAAGRARTFVSNFSLAHIFLPGAFGSVLASVPGDGSAPAILAVNADPRPQLALRVAGAAGSLEYLIRGIAPV